MAATPPPAPGDEFFIMEAEDDSSSSDSSSSEKGEAPNRMTRDRTRKGRATNRAPRSRLAPDVGSRAAPPAALDESGEENTKLAAALAAFDVLSANAILNPTPSPIPNPKMCMPADIFDVAEFLSLLDS